MISTRSGILSSSQLWLSILGNRPGRAQTASAGCRIPAGDPRARALVASAIDCLDAAIDAWTASNGATPLSVLLDQAMGELSELSG